MYRSHNCGELRNSDINKEVKLSGWVQRVRDKGFLIWIDLRDRYGITQLFIDYENVKVFDTPKYTPDSKTGLVRDIPVKTFA